MKRLTYSISFIIIGFVFCHNAQAQTNAGTEFWFSFMEHIDAGDNEMLVMITATKNTSGRISLPGNSFSQAFTVQANDVELIPMPRFAETIGSERISNNAVQVTSEDPVSVYIHQFHEFRSEATVVLPVSSLSTEYFVMSYTGIDAGAGPGVSEFLIVGIEDETTIEYTVSDDTVEGLSRGDTRTITLDRRETFQVKAPRSTNDLTGSFIRGDKVFNVLSGASWSGVPRGCTTFDNLLEQMNPVDTWGSRYVTIPTQTNTQDVFRILSASDNNTITVTDQNGDIQDHTIDRGEFVEYQRNVPTFIEASSPILVAQYLTGRDCTSNSEGDPSMVILNSVEQIRDTITMFNSSFEDINQNFISIIGRTADIDNVTFDGAEITDTWTPIGLTGEFSFVTLSVGVGSHTIISEGCGVIASAFGLGNAESYAYAGGASFNRINANPIPDGECVGVPLLFESGLPPERYNVLWDVGDNGFTSQEHEFEYAYPDEEGEYEVGITIDDLCFNETSIQNKTVKITFRQDIDIASDIPFICEGETLELEALDLEDATYLWNGPLGFESEDQIATIQNINPDMSGMYEVIGIVSGCKTPAKSIDVDVKDTPQISLGRDSVICERIGIPSILSPGDWSSYQWSDGTSAPSLSVIEGGTNAVTITDEFNCVGEASVTFEPRCPTSFYIPTAFSPNGDSINDEFSVEGFDVISMEFVVFDRWGNQVFQTRDHGVDWDGKINGKDSSEGQYAWVLTFNGFDDEGLEISDKKSGIVQLIR